MLAFWAAFMLVFCFLTRGTSWLSYWQPWSALVVTWLLVYRQHRLKECVAGVEWLARRKRWVRLYELTEVTYLGIPFGPLRLRLVDSGGRKVTIRLKDVRAERFVWDLTYNGILHSVVAGGAKTNEKLHLDLYVPYPASRAAAGRG